MNHFSMKHDTLRFVLPSRLLFVLLATIAIESRAQLSERYGAYELFYNVVNSTFVEPAVAAEYGLTRGRRRAIINLSLREHLEDGSTVARHMDIKGSNRDLTGQKLPFDFIEVREGPAIYYIGEFKFINREFKFFEVDFRPENSDERFAYSFKRQMYIND